MNGQKNPWPMMGRSSLLQFERDLLDFACELERYVVAQVHRGTAIFADIQRLVERDADRDRLLDPKWVLPEAGVDFFRPVQCSADEHLFVSARQCDHEKPQQHAITQQV